MPINSQDSLINALANTNNRPLISKANVTATAGRMTSLWTAAGQPGAGSTTLGQAASGAVPTSADTGAMNFTNPTAPTLSYLGKVSGNVGADGTLILWDLLWVWGSGGSGWSVTTTTAQSTTAPAALTRPDSLGTNTEAWLEVLSTMGAGAATPVIGYTNSAGTASRTSGTMGYSSAAATGSMFQFPLQAGDNGVRSIQSLTLSVSMTSGTARVIIARRLAEIPVIANRGFSLNAIDLGMPRVYDSAALFFSFLPQSTASGPCIAQVVIAQG